MWPMGGYVYYTVHAHNSKHAYPLVMRIRWNTSPFGLQRQAHLLSWNDKTSPRFLLKTLEQLTAQHCFGVSYTQNGGQIKRVNILSKSRVLKNNYRAPCISSIGTYNYVLMISNYVSTLAIHCGRLGATWFTNIERYRLGWSQEACTSLNKISHGAYDYHDNISLEIWVMIDILSMDRGNEYACLPS